MKILIYKHNLLKILIIIGLTLLISAFDFWGLQTRISTPDFTNIKNTEMRKQAFFQYLLPFIQLEKNKIISIRENIKKNRLSATELQKLARIYRLESYSKQALLEAIDIIPTSLILAQAANESDWGRSRFAKQYYNFFGLWCFKKGCGVIPKNRNDSDKHEVAKFSSPRQSIAYYLLTLNRHNAYQILRQIRAHKRKHKQKITGIALSEGLNNYSGIGYEYVQILQQIIRHNKLEKYD